jgi:hypothetical protein
MFMVSWSSPFKIYGAKVQIFFHGPMVFYSLRYIKQRCKCFCISNYKYNKLEIDQWMVDVVIHGLMVNCLTK